MSDKELKSTTYLDIMHQLILNAARVNKAGFSENRLCKLIQTLSVWHVDGWILFHEQIFFSQLAVLMTTKLKTQALGRNIALKISWV